MIIQGYEIKSEWIPDEDGRKIAKAEKDGKCFAIRKYEHPIEPIDNGTLDEKAFIECKRKFDDFVVFRRIGNAILKPYTELKGKYFIPIDDFVEEGYYYEVAEVVERSGE